MSNITELRARIEHAFEELPQEIVNCVLDSYEHHLCYCIKVNGTSVEQEYSNWWNFCVTFVIFFC